MNKRNWLALWMTAALVTGCQASTIGLAPAATAAAEADGPRIGVLTAAGSSLVGLRENDLVMSEEAVSGPQTIAITYRRGVEERLSWDGTGHGVAELTNANGQLVYRVEEGAAAKTVLVPAGTYTLMVRPDASLPASPLAITVEPSAGGQVRQFYQPAGPEATRGDRDLCADIDNGLKRLGDLERRIQFTPEPAKHFTEYNQFDRFKALPVYVQQRSYMDSLFTYLSLERRLNGFLGCQGLEKHRPVKHDPFDLSNAFFAPYAYHYYKDHF